MTVDELQTEARRYNAFLAASTGDADFRATALGHAVRLLAATLRPALDPDPASPSAASVGTGLRDIASGYAYVAGGLTDGSPLDIDGADSSFRWFERAARDDSTVAEAIASDLDLGSFDWADIRDETGGAFEAFERAASLIAEGLPEHILREYRDDTIPAACRGIAYHRTTACRILGGRAGSANVRLALAILIAEASLLLVATASTSGVSPSVPTPEEFRTFAAAFDLSDWLAG